jgi:type I restriction enzyme S subunit
VKLGQLLEVTSSKRIFLSDYVDEGIPFYRGKEIILKSRNEALNDLLYISNEKFEEIKIKYDLPKSGDILVTAVGTLGYPYLITESDGAFYFKDGNLIWLKKSKVISSTYLISCFKNENFQAHLLNTAIGSSQKALTISSLKDILILNPKIEIQLKFDDLIIPLLNSIENLQNQKRLLKEARDILLPRLMSGMIDVDAITGQVGEEMEMIQNKKVS